MSWPVFYLIASGLVAFLLLLVLLPFLKRKGGDNHHLSNAQIVRQRLQELEREAAEGVISQSDKRQAIDELKLSLVDETAEETATGSASALPVLLAGVVAVIIAMVVYWQVNHLNEVKRADKAVAALPELSRKLAEQGGEDFTADDVADLALAIRQRLRVDENDAMGWMFLGRLWMSTGQDSQAIDALEKARTIEPDNTTVRIALAQAYMASGDESNLRRAQRLLENLLIASPQSNNLALLMAVASSQLGDLENTRRYFEKVKGVLTEQSPMYQSLTARIAELEGRQAQLTPGPAQPTGFEIVISVAPELKEKLPSQGYLIVFAQDAKSDNKMPAAVIKMPLEDLPVRLSLTTGNAMLPGYTLAQLEEVRLVARVSRDEEVFPQPGELEGEITAPVVPGKIPQQTITINKEIM